MYGFGLDDEEGNGQAYHYFHLFTDGPLKNRMNPTHSFDVERCERWSRQTYWIGESPPLPRVVQPPVVALSSAAENNRPVCLAWCSTVTERCLGCACLAAAS